MQEAAFLPLPIFPADIQPNPPSLERQTMTKPHATKTVDAPTILNANRVYAEYSDAEYEALEDVKGVRGKMIGKLMAAEVPFETALEWLTDHIDEHPVLLVTFTAATEKAAKDAKTAAKTAQLLEQAKPIGIRPGERSKKDNKPYNAMALLRGASSDFASGIFSEQGANAALYLRELVNACLSVEKGEHDLPELDRRAKYRAFRSEAKTARQLSMLERLTKIQTAIDDCDLSPLTDLAESFIPEDVAYQKALIAEAEAKAAKAANR
jgi:hypothetical protein